MKKRLKLNVKNYKLNKFKLQKQAEILENISLFLNRGYSLNESLNLLKFRYNLWTYIEELEEGLLLSEILKNKKYDPDILLVIELAERSGNLKLGVRKAYLIILQKIKNKNNIIEILKYPALLGLIMLIALGFISLFLMPQFQTIYESFGMELGATIKILFALIKILPLLIFIIFCGIITLGIYFIRLPFDQKMKIVIKNKFIKHYYIRLYNHIFAVNIVNLLTMGLRIDEILIILANQEYNILLKKESIRILQELKEGKLLHETIQNDYYSDEIIMIIKDGEIFSTLVHSLENYTIYLEKNQEARAKKMIFLIQPIFYGLFGILIIILYASIFIPMFQMMESI